MNSTNEMTQADAQLQADFSHWVFSALGPKYCLLLPLAGMVLIVAACFVIVRRWHPTSLLAFLIVLPVPVLVGAFAALESQIMCLNVVSYATTTPSAAEIAEGVTGSLFRLYTGIGVTIPAYLILGIGWLIRNHLSANSTSPSEGVR